MAKKSPKQRGPDEQSDLQIVEDFFRLHGFDLKRFSKEETRVGKTPDYRVMRGDSLFAYCEVKSPRDDWLNEQLDDAPAETIVGGLRDDPVFNRLSRIIEKAASQFDAVNQDREVPNILFLVNHDDASDYEDIRETLTGMFFAEDGSKHPTIKHISEGKIKNLKLRIDAYIWYDHKTRRVQGWIFSESNSHHFETICAAFRLNKEKIER